MELRSMPVDGELTSMTFLLEAILFMLTTRKNFELAQTWLNAFLAIHGDLIIGNPDNDTIHTLLQHILSIQQEEFGRLSEKIHYGLCVIDFARKS
jgi:U3 small nucleolar RNA-associated protein 21